MTVRPEDIALPPTVQVTIPLIQVTEPEAEGDRAAGASAPADEVAQAVQPSRDRCANASATRGR